MIDGIEEKKLSSLGLLLLLAAVAMTLFADFDTENTSHPTIGADIHRYVG